MLVRFILVLPREYMDAWGDCRKVGTPATTNATVTSESFMSAHRVGVTTV
ncbi:MAG: hypothetical protein PHE53_09355 [Thermoguttaceae bacterium]|nr:hypothetical protein [Thermoguttaceae bacterium]